MSDQIRTEHRIWGLVAYALTPVGALVALLVCGDDEGLRHHARQSVLAGLIVAALALVLSQIAAIGCLSGLLALAFWGYMLFCGIRAYRSQDVKLPLISALLWQPGGQ